MPTIFSPMRAITLVRIFIGLVVLSAGLNKVLIVGTTNFNAFIHSLPQLGMLQDMVGLGLPWIEIILGFFLVFGVFTRITAAITAFIFAGMIGTMGFFSKPGEISIHYHSFIFLQSLALIFVGKEPTLWSFDTWYKKIQKAKHVKTIKV